MVEIKPVLASNGMSMAAARPFSFVRRVARRALRLTVSGAALRRRLQSE
jgi:hypothetical protein